MGLLTWSADDMPDMFGKVVVVTGADSGLGFEICKRMAEHHAHVVMVSRRLEPGERARDRLLKKIPFGKVSLMQCDMSSFRSVESFAELYKATSLPLHVLVNDASVWLPDPETTNDNFDLTLQVNYYAVAYLTHLLLDSLKLSAPSRIVNVVSRAEMFGRIPWSDLRGLRWSKRQRGWTAYTASKLMLMMYSKELAARLEGTGVDVFVAHPGLSDTQMASKVDRETYWPLPTIAALAGVTIAQPVEWGARPILYVASAEKLRGKSAKQGWFYVWGPILEQLGPNVTARPPFNPVAWRPANYTRLFNQTWMMLMQTRPNVGRESLLAPLIETVENANEIAEIMEEAAEQAAEDLAEAMLMSDAGAAGLPTAGQVPLGIEGVMLNDMLNAATNVLETVMGEAMGEEMPVPILDSSAGMGYPAGMVPTTAGMAGSAGGERMEKTGVTQEPAGVSEELRAGV